MEAEVLDHTAIDAADWDKFIEESPQGMIYHKYHYISNLCTQWQAVVVRNGEQLLALMPFEAKKKYGISYSLQPVFAQYWGICFPPMNSKISRTYELKKQYTKLIIDKIPKRIRIFNYHFSPRFDYPLPLIWSGYKLTPRDTYQVDIAKTEEEIYAEFAENTRRDIKKAQKAGITIQQHNHFDTLLNIGERSWGKNVKSVKPEQYQSLKKVYNHFSKTGESYLLTAQTGNGDIAAGILFFTFKDTTIYYFGGTAPEYKQSGAMSLIIWEAIKNARNNGYKVFDFDGSMIEPIERFLRGFGAVPVPYMRVRKNSLLPGNVAIRLPFSR